MAKESYKPGKHGTDAQVLIAQGYRRVSNRYRIVARIDRPDWLQYMALKLGWSVAEFYIQGSRPPTPRPMWCSHYRRVYSEDWIEGVPAEMFKAIPSSDFDPVQYVPIGENDEHRIDHLHRLFTGGSG